VPEPEVVTEPPAGVFLSYSTRDQTTARAIKSELERRGVAVRVDFEHIGPGDPIRGFIMKSIRATLATVLIVSEASLLSDWVALEVGTSLVASELGQRLFVACYLDEGFLDLGFGQRAVGQIDARLSEVDRLIVEAIASKRDPVDLNPEKTRLTALRYGLGPLLERLRASLCLDVRGDALLASIEKLAAKLGPLLPGGVLRDASNVEERAKEIYGLVENDEPERALQRVMDFVHAFSDDRRRVDESRITLGEFRALKKDATLSPRERHRLRRQILKEGLRLLGDTIDALSRPEPRRAA
jgi:hypothetical protein